LPGGNGTGNKTKTSKPLLNQAFREEQQHGGAACLSAVRKPQSTGLQCAGQSQPGEPAPVCKITGDGGRQRYVGLDLEPRVERKLEKEKIK
jgi:hypothetical protein